MSQPPDPDPIHVNNTASGQVSGNVVMAGAIHGGVNVYGQARQPKSLPYRYGPVLHRAASFQRRAITTRLVETVADGHTAVLTSDGPATTSVLTGLGGVGKTQLAVDYAETAWATGELDLLVWITAMSREAIVSDYARLAADLTGIEDADPEHGARRLLAWLSGSSARWLVVLDDVQTPADLVGLWPPNTSSGRIVVTTRSRDAALHGHRRRLIDVEVFQPAEATAYLTDVLGGWPHLLDDVAELVADLGCLPLALAQASAYMRDRQLSCADYRARLADQRRHLAGLLPEADSLPDEHRATVAATWSLSVERANQLEPAGVAGVLLEVASVLDANGIPVEVFTAPSVLALLSAATGREIGADDARDGLGCAHRLSLLTLDADSSRRNVRVHALVQRVTRDNMAALPGTRRSRAPLDPVHTLVRRATHRTISDDRRAGTTRAAADALMWAWPDIERDTVLGRVLRANALAMIAVAGRHLWEPDGHDVLFRAGGSLGEAGLVVQARDYFAQLTTAAKRYLGRDHLATLFIRSHLAYWRGKAGDPDGAAKEFEELLADERRILGPDHPETVTTRGNLAYWQGETGDHAGAITAAEELLADCRRILGPDHPDTLTTRANLAYWQGEAGDHVGAILAFDDLLADHRRVLGPDHPATLFIRSHLIGCWGSAGDAEGAAKEFEELLADCRRILGPDHPATLTIRGHLIDWRGQAGDPGGAATAAEELLADCRRVLGPDHPDTLSARSQLAYWQKRWW